MHGCDVYWALRVAPFGWFDIVPTLRVSLRRDLPLVDLTLFDSIENSSRGTQRFVTLRFRSFSLRKKILRGSLRFLAALCVITLCDLCSLLSDHRQSFKIEFLIGTVNHFQEISPLSKIILQVNYTAIRLYFLGNHQLPLGIVAFH